MEDVNKCLTLLSRPLDLPLEFDWGNGVLQCGAEEEKSELVDMVGEASDDDEAMALAIIAEYSVGAYVVLRADAVEDQDECAARSGRQPQRFWIAKVTEDVGVGVNAGKLRIWWLDAKMEFGKYQEQYGSRRAPKQDWIDIGDVLTSVRIGGSGKIWKADKKLVIYQMELLEKRLARGDELGHSDSEDPEQGALDVDDD